MDMVPMPKSSLAFFAPFLLGFLVGCSEDNPAQPAPGPEILEVEAQANPTNVLSGVIAFEADNTEFARVISTWSLGDSLAQQTGTEITPFFPVQEDANRITVLDLPPGAPVTSVVEAVSSDGDTSRSEPVDFVTGELPDAIRDVHMNVSTGALTPGFIVTGFFFTDLPYILVFDDTGELCWYREIDGYAGEDVSQKANGACRRAIESSSTL